MERVTVALRAALNNWSEGSMPRDVLFWADPEVRIHSLEATVLATTLPFETALPAREGTNYPGRLNHAGYYWFAGSNRHVRHESMLEYTALMWLDYTHQIRSIAAQPMVIRFRDGTTHVPDFFAVERSERRLLIDVHPIDLMDDIAVVQFDKTGAICRRVGWTYMLLTEFRTGFVNNLEWLAAYRHPRYAPTPDLTEAVCQFTARATSLDEALAWLKVAYPAAGISVLYNLMWQRVLSFSEDVPLSWSTKVWTGRTA